MKTRMPLNMVGSIYVCKIDVKKTGKIIPTNPSLHDKLCYQQEVNIDTQVDKL